MSDTAHNSFSTAAWGDAERVAALVALAPSEFGGVCLRSAPGPVRDVWLETLENWLPDCPMRRIPAHVTQARLLGGIDLAATLHSGRPVAERGLIANCHDGIALVAMAERCQRETVAHLCAALDNGEIALQRDGLAALYPAQIAVIALDEGIDDEHASPTLCERLAFYLDLHALSIRDIDATHWTSAALNAARELYPRVELGTEHVEALATLSLLLGIDSPRAWILAGRVARGLAALDGRTTTEEADVLGALRLCLAHRATQLPPSSTEEETQPEPAPEQDDAEPERDQEQPDQQERGELPEHILEAAAAAVPPALLAQLNQGLRSQSRNMQSGKSGAMQRQRQRGRPIGVVAGDPRHGGRMSIIDTLRAAVPWQQLRKRDGRAGPAIDVRRDDFRLLRFSHRTESTTIFVVDASGSAALHRLAEAKGAVELLLADCYVRRDQVALIAFRGEQAELLLPPTRSLVRAKRSLAGLPGGGGTPLASALVIADQLAGQIKRSGGSPGFVFLTDGVANIARDGSRGREQAGAEALELARAIGMQGLRSIVIDTSPRANVRAQRLAEALQARYVVMPHADANRMKQAVEAAGIRN